MPTPTQFVQYPSQATASLGAVDQGNPNTPANAWPVKITDGVNVEGIAPASTAATGVQPAGVVALSPNTPLPAGSNALGSVSVSGSVLPAGAATAVNQITQENTLVNIESLNASMVSNQTNGTQTVSVLNFPGTQPVSGTVTVIQPTGTNLHTVVDSGTVVVTQGTGTNLHTVVDSGSVTVAGTVAVSNFPGTQPVSGTVTANAGTGNFNTLQQGKSKVALLRNDYSGVNVTTGAYVQLIASTSANINYINIFDSSGQTMALGLGAPGSEVALLYIFPGGNGREDVFIPSGSRVSVIAISANATVGELDINCFS